MDDKRIETIVAGFTHEPIGMAMMEALRWVRDEAFHEAGAISADWKSADTAPRDGTHIMVAFAPYDRFTTFAQRPPQVVHFFPDPDEPGFYPSSGIVQDSYNDHPVTFTHWMPLPETP